MKDKKNAVGFLFAWNGIREVMITERNFRIHLLMTVIVLFTGLFLQLHWLEWCMIIFAIGFVLVTELLNSAVEKMMDYLNPAIHPTAKAIKDITAGAVLVSAMTAAVIGFIIFLPKIYVFLKTLFV